MFSRLACAVIGVVPPPVLDFVSHNQWRVPGLRRVFAWGASRFKGRDGVIVHGVGRGLRLNVGSSHSAFLTGTHKPEMQSILAAVLRSGMVYFDVGANVGFFSVLAARLVGPSGKVECFEPLPANAERIRHNARLNGFNNVTVHAQALGDVNRTELFQTSAEPTWGKLSTAGGSPDKVSGAIEVEVRKLDSLRNAQRLPYPDVLKMDIEGAEAEALRGAAATLAEKRPMLMIELHGTNEAVMNVLEELKYVAWVPGSRTPVREAHWNANIVAVPSERTDLLHLQGRNQKVSLWHG